MKKRIAGYVMTLVMAVSLCACGAKDNVSEPTASPEVTHHNIIKVIDVGLTDEQYAIGVDKAQPKLLESVNEYIKEIKEDGTLETICNRYFGDGQPQAVVSAKRKKNKDQLVVATNAEFEPFEYKSGDVYYGIDMEIAAGLAKKLGKELVIKDMDFDAVCLFVGQHKCDLAIAGLTILDSRKKNVDFSESYYDATQKLIVNSSNTEFDACTDRASVEAVLKDWKGRVGVQKGTTGQSYCEGDKDAGFSGFSAEVVTYQNIADAIQTLIDGNISGVIVDSAPAEWISGEFNEIYAR